MVAVAAKKKQCRGGLGGWGRRNPVKAKVDGWGRKLWLALVGLT